MFGRVYQTWFHLMSHIDFFCVIHLFKLRTVKTFLMDVQNTYSEHAGKKRKMYLMLFIALTQPFLMWWLTRFVA